MMWHTSDNCNQMQCTSCGATNWKNVVTAMEMEPSDHSSVKLMSKWQRLKSQAGWRQTGPH